MSSKKRTLLSDNPPSPQSSDDEEDDDPEEEEIQRTPGQSSDDEAAVEEEEEVAEEADEEEEEEEEEAAAEEEEDGGDSKQNSPSAVPESDGETESDSPSENKFTVKPIEKDDDDSKKKAAVSVLKSKKASGGGEEEEGKKSTAFNRKWSLDDEIAVLKGMIDFKKIKNKDPSSNHDEFYKFVINKINYVGFNKNQVMDKIKRLKKKYKGIVSKSKESGKKLTDDTNNNMVFKMSKQIWGDIDLNYKNKNIKSSGCGDVMGLPGNGIRKSAKRVGGAVENNEVVEVKKAKKETAEMSIESSHPAAAAAAADEKKTTTPAEQLYPHLMGAFEEAHWPRVALPPSFKSCLGMLVVDGSILEEWNQMWKEIQVAETEAYLHRIALVKKQTKCFLKAMKSSSSS